MGKYPTISGKNFKEHQSSLINIIPQFPPLTSPHPSLEPQAWLASCALVSLWICFCQTQNLSVCPKLNFSFSILNGLLLLTPSFLFMASPSPQHL